MKKMKKLLAGLMAATMVMSMSVTAFADETTKQDTNPTFSKTYTEVNENSVSPKETFTFNFTADKVTDTNKNLDKSNMPTISPVTVEFASGEASTDGLEKDIEVNLSQIQWPGVGVYYYNVAEVSGDTAGVQYNSGNINASMKITVAYDQGTDTYYTAFVTLSDKMDVDENPKDDVTDSKVAGFDNTYSAGELTVQKLVDGNLADTTAKFIIVVTFEAPTNKTVREDITFDGNGTVYNVSGTGAERTLEKIESGNVAVAASDTDGWNGTKTVAIEVSHEQYVTFENIPYNVVYTVTEDDYTAEEKGKYETAIYNNDADADSNNETTLVIDDASDKVVITNQKGVVVDTGISLDNMPYIMVLAMVALGLVGFVSKKRSMEF